MMYGQMAMERYVGRCDVERYMAVMSAELIGRGGGGLVWRDMEDVYEDRCPSV